MSPDAAKKNRLHASPSRLSAASRERLCAEYNRLLADTLDLFSQVKTAHWNVRGLGFMAIHELFDKVSEEVEMFSDMLAEGIVKQFPEKFKE